MPDDQVPEDPAELDSAIENLEIEIANTPVESAQYWILRDQLGSMEWSRTKSRMSESS